jgi:hypothetical protein
LVPTDVGLYHEVDALLPALRWVFPCDTNNVYAENLILRRKFKIEI